MKKTFIILMVILSLLFISGCGSFDDYLDNYDSDYDLDYDSSSDTNNISANEANANPEYSITSEQILKEYDENGVKAATQYKNKVVEITGKIDEINVDITGDAYITLTDGTDFSLTNVKCTFLDSQQINKLNDLVKNQTITVVGTVDDYSFNLYVKNCSIK